METQYIEELEALNPCNFWIRAKMKYLGFTIEKPGAIILDVGCGSGGTMAHYVEQGFKVLGIDINEHALNLCKEKGYEVFQIDLQRENIPCIILAPDYIAALDFIEHVQCPVEVLNKLRAISHPDTQLIITVPSYQFLFSEWDKLMGHVKRYNRRLLCSELEKGGWKVTRSTYIHVLPLIPAILLRKIIKPLIHKVAPEHREKRERFFDPHPILNTLLRCIYYLEFLWFRAQLPIPFGLSVLAIATPEVSAT